MAISFKGAHFPQEVILMGVRWYLAYPLSTRHVEELMEERGVELDHATINRWVIKYSLCSAKFLAEIICHFFRDLWRSATHPVADKLLQEWSRLLITSLLKACGAADVPHGTRQ